MMYPRDAGYYERLAQFIDYERSIPSTHIFAAEISDQFSMETFWAE